MNRREAKRQLKRAYRDLYWLEGKKKEYAGSKKAEKKGGKIRALVLITVISAVIALVMYGLAYIAYGFSQSSPISDRERNLTILIYFAFMMSMLLIESPFVRYEELSPSELDCAMEKVNEEIYHINDEFPDIRLPSPVKRKAAINMILTIPYFLAFSYLGHLDFAYLAAGIPLFMLLAYGYYYYENNSAIHRMKSLCKKQKS